MKKAIKMLIHTFFRKDQELRVKLFHVLAMAGTVICILMAIQSFAVGAGISSILINVGTSILSASLLLYSAKSGNYQFCYMITIFLIFLVLFPALFLTGGGYRSGMPFFFLFA
ncbi:MAG: sensor histidine kinase, partial [Otoolea sp.]